MRDGPTGKKAWGLVAKRVGYLPDALHQLPRLQHISSHFPDPHPLLTPIVEGNSMAVSEL